MYSPYYTKRFAKQLKKFPKKEQLKILDKISTATSDPRKFSTKLESTGPPVYKTRAGEYRIFFELDNKRKIMKITDVFRRTTQTYR